MIKNYYKLTKPGIVYGNALVAAAAFVFAGHHIDSFNWLMFCAMLTGLSCVVASACVANNYIDRDIDAKMERTKSRPLVVQSVSNQNAIIFELVLLIIGIALLYFFTNLLALGVALAGFVIYVALYTPLKRKTGYALFVGAIAGAAPPVAGYVAATNTLDVTALWLFLFLFVWQLPHFIAVAYYRFDEYKSAGIPLLIKKNPTPRQKYAARAVFYASLVVLLLWCAWLVLV